MARKIIDIGVVGNDGTGDSIRDSFRKVNDNFRELYSSLGLGEKLRFIELEDTPDSATGYIGQNDPITGATPVLTVNNTETGIAFKQLKEGTGISLDFITNPNEITINSDFAAISADPDPQLGGNLSARSGGSQFRILDLGTNETPLNPIFKHEVANKAYVDTKIARDGVNAIDPETGNPNTAFGRMTGPLILSRDPEPEDSILYDGLIAATKNYVDNSGFGSSINLYVAKSGLDERPGLSPNLQGRALSYAYRTIGAAMRKADELVIDAPFELGPYQKVLTFNNGVSNCTLTDTITAPNSGTGFEGIVRLSVDTVKIRSSGSTYYPGDILEIVGGQGVATCRLRVLSTLATPGPIQSIQILSRGVYETDLPGATAVPSTIVSSGAPTELQELLGFNPLGTGATFDLTYRVNSVVITNKGSNYGLVSVRITGGGGSGAFGVADVVGGEIDSITITDSGSKFTSIPTLVVNLPRFLINTGGSRTDFSGDFDGSGNLINARTQDIRPGLFLRGETSGALAQILEHTGELLGDDEIFDVDIKLGEFQIGEEIAYGDVSKFIQISVIIESGIYEEHYPIKIPQNVALLGDEFRRVIIRPINDTISASPWALDLFRRDILLGRQNRDGVEFDQDRNQWISTGEIASDLLQIADRLYGYHYLKNTAKPVYNNSNNQIVNRGSYQSAVSLLLLNKTFLQEETVAWINQQIENANITNDVNSIWYNFEYDSELCRRDVGLIIEAVSFDLKLGSYNNTIAAGLRYFESNSSRRVITPFSNNGQLEQHIASIRRLNTLTQLVLKNIEIEKISNQPILQTIDLGIISEMGTVGKSWPIKSIIKGVGANEPSRIILQNPSTLNSGNRIIIADAEGISELNGEKFFVDRIDNDTFDLYLDSPELLEARPVQIQTDDSHIENTGQAIEPLGIVGQLFQALIDVCESDPDNAESLINFPKNNEELDVFLCNDATILRRVTAQGHGGFMMVLDPIGQILAKSPYAQECASFSRSINQQTFAGGMYVDGFTGNLQFKFLEKVNNLDTRLRVGGLSRLPQLPASVIVDDEVYRINYVRNFILDPFGVNGNTAELELSINTPFDRVPGKSPCSFSIGDDDIAVVQATEHRLQPGATVVFSGSSLPEGLIEDVEYYVLETGFTSNQFTITGIFGTTIPVTITNTGTGEFQRIYEILMPGNRSMLANDFTQINDMGYGLVTNNAGLLEAVSVFTYYCFISYYSVNGGQIRSISGSSAHGVYALVAEGFDILEVPTPTGLFFENSQRVICVNDGNFVTDGFIIFITKWNYLPISGSEIEVNHNGVIVRYPITSVQREEDNPLIAKLSIRGLTGLGDTPSDGLIDEILDGAPLTVRINDTLILTGDIADVATRPSTGLKLFEQPDRIYRVLEFLPYEDSEAPFEIEIEPGTPGIFSAVSTITNIDNNVCTTLKNHRLRPGDTFIPLESAPGLTVGQTYQIESVPDYDQFILQGTSLTNGTGLSIRGKKSHNFRENFKIQFTTADGDQLPQGVNPSIEYFIIADGLTEVDFRVSTVLNGSAIDVDGAGQGDSFYAIKGLALTLLRESYDYVNLTLWEPGEFVDQNDLKTVTITIGSATVFTSTVAHELQVNDVIRILPSDPFGLPTGLTSRRNYFVVSTPSTTQFTISRSLAGTPIDTSGTQTGTFQVGKVTGRQGDSSFAVVPLASGLLDLDGNPTQSDDERRVVGSNFVFLGKKYTIINYEDPSATEDEFARITLDRQLEDSIINLDSVYTIRSSLPPTNDNVQGTLTIRISLVRVTGHDLLDIGTGSYADTNYPNEIFGPPANVRDATKEVQERDVGRVFYVTTDQFGNFNVGPFFNVDQGTGQVTFSTTVAFTNLNGLGFKRGVSISEFSVDQSMARNAQDTVPTENAVRGYVERRLGISHTGSIIPPQQRIPATTGGFLPLLGNLPMVGNIDLNNNRIRNLLEPSQDNDAVNKEWVKLSNLQDGTLTSTSDANLLMLTGSQGNFVNVANNTADIINTSSSEGGGSDVVLSRSGNTVTIKLRGGLGDKNPITNRHINNNAGIIQSKLVLNSATTRANATNITQADRGLASFNSTEFETNNGWVSIKTNGIGLTRIAKIGTRRLLGNPSGTETADISAIQYTTVVDEGGAVKKSQYSATGFLRRDSAVNFTQDDNYSIIESSAAYTGTSDNNKLIQRDPNGDFAARNADLQSLLINSKTALNSGTIATGGFLRLLGFNGQGGIFLQDGSLATDKTTFYDNDSHRFRTQDGQTDAPIRASSVQTLSLTTGGNTAGGTITGRWTLTGTSPNESRLQATYSADLAEYYEGDKEYDVGTVLVFGGDKEVTVANKYMDVRVAGVVSNTAAFVMYDACPGFKNLVALQGRVPCRVVGKINKGDMLVTSNIPGVAVAAIEVKVGTVIGKALLDYNSDHIGTIEVAVGRA